MKGVCDVSHISVLFSTILVYTVNRECQPIFLIPIGSKIIQHNKEKLVCWFRNRLIMPAVSLEFVVNCNVRPTVFI